MRDLAMEVAALAVSSLTLFATACNKGPAEEALAVAEQALAAARPDLERYGPRDLATLAAALRQARAELDRRHYTDALRAAQGLPSRIRVAAAAAAAKKEEQVAAWNEMSASVPGLIQAITAKVAELEAAKTLAKGLDEAGFVAAQANLGSVTQAWNEAAAAFQGGDVPRAVEKARDVQAKAEALAGMLRVVVAPPSAR
jgi:hypothetical protein